MAMQMVEAEIIVAEASTITEVSTIMAVVQAIAPILLSKIVSLRIIRHVMAEAYSIMAAVQAIAPILLSKIVSLRIIQHVTAVQFII